MLIYNTLTNKKEEFIPIEKNKVKMYVCGPTVYNYFHIGNARPFLFFDVVRSYFKFIGYEVIYVQNLTDIDDKIIQKANEDKVEYFDITKKYIDAFFEDCKALGIAPADVNPKATEFINEMVDLIHDLIKKEYAYESNGDVYFSVSKIKHYGRLSGKNLSELQVGARIEANEQKRNPFDFTLWKKAKENEPSWDSPWGKGRPGWHTECIVMSNKYLGETFDIHGGGIDLIFPHHENEIAHSEALCGKPHANYWMHNGFVNIDGDKMSKSLNNFFTTRDVLKLYDADTIRFFFLSKHYRSPIDYNKEILEESKTAMNRFYEVFKKFPVHELTRPDIVAAISNHHFRRGAACHTQMEIDIFIPIKEQFDHAMNDDFNTAKAIACLFDLAKIAFSQNHDNHINQVAAFLLYDLGLVLGFFKDLESKLSNKLGDKAEKLINLLIDLRNQAKKDKNFALADKIRDSLKDIGIELRDTPDGTTY